MSAEKPTKLSWKQWRIGAMESLFLSLLVAGAGVAADMGWKAFIAVFCASAVTHYGAFRKQHPVEEVEDTTFKPRGTVTIERKDGGHVLVEWAIAAGILVMVICALCGCRTQQHGQKQMQPAAAGAARTTALQHCCHQVKPIIYSTYEKD